MNTERPITFTVSQNGDGNTYSITSKDARAKRDTGDRIGFKALSSYDIFRIMEWISRELNAKGYAVLFEVD